MDKVKELARKAWTKYRSWPMWGQILGGILLLSVIVGPFTDANKKKDAEAKPAETSSVVTDLTEPATTYPATTSTAPATTGAATTSTAPATTEAATSTTAPPTTVQTTTTTITPPPSCVDDRNDGAGNFDLIEASLHTVGGNRVAVATFVGPSSGRDVFVSFILSRDQDGEDYAYQIGAERSADGSVTAYVFDVGESTNTDLDTAIFDDGRVQVSIPAELISEVQGNNVNFQVDLNVDGNDIDSCP